MARRGSRAILVLLRYNLIEVYKNYIDLLRGRTAMQDVRTRGYAVVFLWLTLSVATGHAATYHVSLSAGSDSTPWGGPRRSIAAGIACLASGDTLLVSGGTYTECLTDYGAARPPSGSSWATATRSRPRRGKRAQAPAPGVPRRVGVH